MSIYSSNQWNQAPTPIPVAVPGPQQATTRLKFHSYKPKDSAPTQTVTAAPGPQQVTNRLKFYSYTPKESAPTQTVTAVPGPQQVPASLPEPLEVQSQSEKEMPRTPFFSFAKTTWLCIDESTLKIYYSPMGNHNHKVGRKKDGKNCQRVTKKYYSLRC